MTWTKIDSALPDDPRLLRLSRGRRWTYLEGLVWSNKHGTDGAIPRHALRRVTDDEEPENAAAELVAAGLWEKKDDGWSIVGFLTNQPSRADVEKTQAFTKERQRRQRQHRGGDHSLCQPKYCDAASRVTNGVTYDYRTDPSVPPRPEGTRGGKGGAEAGSAKAPPARATRKNESCPHRIRGGLAFDGQSFACGKCEALVPNFNAWHEWASTCRAHGFTDEKVEGLTFVTAEDLFETAVDVAFAVYDRFMLPRDDEDDAMPEGMVELLTAWILFQIDSTYGDRWGELAESLAGDNPPPGD